MYIALTITILLNGFPITYIERMRTVEECHKFREVIIKRLDVLDATCGLFIEGTTR